jgi:lambda family phage portal protein
MNPLLKFGAALTSEFGRMFGGDPFTFTGGGHAAAYPAAAPPGNRRAMGVRRSGGGPNRIAEGNFSTLRTQSRRVLRINPLAFSAKSTLVSNAVGTGIKPLFKTSDAAFNQQAAALWDQWVEESDADGSVDFYGMQSLAFGSMFEAGEVFARIRQRRQGDLRTVPLQIQMLESEYVPIEKTEPSGIGNIRMGIEFNGIGQRTAYWMYRNHPDDGVAFGAFDTLPYPVPASEVLHIYDNVFRRPGLIRGEPWLARILQALDDLDDYQDAERTRKKLAAMYSVFITRPVPDGMSDEMLQETFGANAYIDENGIGVPTLEPGIVTVLGPGESVEPSAPADVGQSYEPFIRNQYRAIAAGAGVMYEQLTGDYSQVNDRTYRAAVGEFRRLVEMWQHLTMVHQFCSPIHRRWLATALVSGQLKRPKGMTDADLFSVRWVPPKWQYLNPVQDVQAEEAEVKAGFRSRADVITARGYDAEAVDAEIANDQARADSLGLVFSSSGRMPAAPAQDPAQAQNQ